MTLKVKKVKKKAIQVAPSRIRSTLKSDWWLFCDNYISIAELACREMLHQKYGLHYSKTHGDVGPPRFWIYSLYVSMVFNLKHSIEIFLKYFLLVIEDKIPEFGKDGHDIERYLELFQKKHNVERINKVVRAAYASKKESRYSLDGAEMEAKYHDEWFKNIARLSIKYFRCQDIQEKVRSFEFKDVCNDGFRYPHNKMKIDLNYSEIVHSLTKEDIAVVLSDINELQNAFNSLRFLTEVYNDVKD